MAPTTYQYAPLPSSLHGSSITIRIMALLPADYEQGPLTAELICLPLGTAQNRYEALSYTWGDDNQDSTLLIGGDVLPITRNLEVALRRLRQEEVRYLWADAICINQSDDQERTDQVSVMASIYGSAARTIVWLGEPNDSKDSETMFKFLRKMSPACKVLSRRQQDLSSETSIDLYIDTYLSRNVTQATFQRFLQLPWFSRRWVLQEVFCAKDAVMLWGSDTLPWETFLLVLHTLIWDSGQRRYCIVQFSTFIELSTRWEILETLGRSNVLQFMEAFHMFGCKDPRDRIGALQGLWRDHDRYFSAYTVEYTATVEENYIRFALVLAESPSCEELLLCAAQRLQGRARDPKAALPSWVPDWRVTPLSMHPTYQEVYGTGADCRAQRAGIPHAVRLRCWLLDTIVSIDFTLLADQHAVKVHTRSGQARLIPTYTTPDGLGIAFNIAVGDFICVFADPPLREFVLRPLNPLRNEFCLFCECGRVNEMFMTLDDCWRPLGAPTSIVLV